MKYRLELLIHKPRAQVWSLFTDTERVKLWQPSLVTLESVSGLPFQPGAIVKWTYQENGREFSLTENVLKRKEPETFVSVFENAFAKNTVEHLFTEQSNSETQWVMETDYRFKTLLMKILGPRMKQNYVARSQQEMDCFKEMVEQT